MTDKVTDELAAMLGRSPEDPQPIAASTQQTGRGPSGKLRNFKAMNDGKLAGVLADVRAENNDPEALAALEAEAKSRGLSG